ncbi:hypothetical protein [Streptomyces sp. NPDC059957]|uniref:hypothetical protein n=1 Tax=Streptomyces sp. NPDC059957 TaxID=3347016 RepID=UPI00364B7256
MSGSNGQNSAPRQENQPNASEPVKHAASGPSQGADSFALSGKGIFDSTVPMRFVNHTSRVFVSLAELYSVDRTPFMGGANIRVLNVVPKDGGEVEIRVEVEYPEELPLLASVFYFNGF